MEIDNGAPPGSYLNNLKNAQAVFFRYRLGGVSHQIFLAGNSKVLDKASVPRGAGAIICTRKELSALNKDAMLVPVWAI
jgi:hypothetical protein